MKILRFFQTRLASAASAAAGKAKAFTLIELLVVISIIAILAGLLFPVMGAVRTQARKASAKNDITQIVVGVKNYYTDYGKYPVDSTVTTDTTFTGDNNSKLFDVLVTGTTGNGPTLNPRQIRYLEVANVKDPARPKSGLKNDTTPIWYDPWGTPYVIFIDGDYNGSISTSYSDFTTVRTGVGAASYGVDMKPGVNGAGKYGGSDDIISWQ